jgi:hypothetical protein
MSDRGTRKADWGLLVFSTLALLWAGMILGVSGIATPVKFSAPMLTLPVALDVGRTTFNLFNKIELTLCVLLLLIAIVAARRAIDLAAVGGVGAIVAWQAVSLIPALDAQVSRIIDGSSSPPSWQHSAYIVAEASKIILLVFTALHALRRVRLETAAGDQSFASACAPREDKSKEEKQ